jgi:AraC-like DNA-binding protein
MKFLIIHIAALIAIFQCLFLSLFFFTNKRGDSTSNKIFALLLLVFSANICYSFTLSKGMIEYFNMYAREISLIGQMSFLVGPLLYLYVKSQLLSNFKFHKKNLIHFIVFTIAIAFMLILPVNSISYNSYRLIKFFYNIAPLIQDAFYLGLIFYTFRKNNIRLKDFFWQGNARITWLRIFVVGFILIWNIKLQGFIAFNVEELWQFCPYTESLYFLILFLFLNVIIFTVLRKPELFTPIKRYESSELDPQSRANYISTLKSAMETEKLYLDPKLTLPLLSQKLYIPIRHLSQIINEEFNKNFNDYINCYRIAESKKLFRENSNSEKGILEIAYSVGFNSKSAFYDAFKKSTGLTPKQFKMEIINNN